MADMRRADELKGLPCYAISTVASADDGLCPVQRLFAVLYFAATNTAPINPPRWSEFLREPRDSVVTGMPLWK